MKLNTRPKSSANGDIWIVDGKGLSLEEDEQCPIELQANGEQWFACYESIDTKRLILLSSLEKEKEYDDICPS
ncbi:hypothetical protein [Neptuniibacter sp. QD37_11]|uniref:hypothetical protein n=1 Tax=Neptuniibacter sp. QD37_11 TaxID=3398209 RepID=UPI0039F5CAF2